MTELEKVTVTETEHVMSFDDVLRIADVLAQSRVIPKDYRNRAADIVAVGLAGQAFKWDIPTSMRNYHVIEGTASLRPEAMVALVRRHGHSIQTEISDDSSAGRTVTATGKRRDNDDTHVAVFSQRDAEAAGLWKKKNWQQYPDAMLTWRAMSQLCRVLFPDVLMGAAYTPEELGAEVTASGDIVEPDPFSDPMIPIGEAKRRLLDACDGDKESARRHWESQRDLPAPDGVRESALEELIAQVRDSDIVDAEIVVGTDVPDGFYPCGRCGQPVPNGVGNAVGNGDVMVCDDCDKYWCQGCGFPLEDGVVNALCAVCSDEENDRLEVQA